MVISKTLFRLLSVRSPANPTPILLMKLPEDSRFNLGLNQHGNSEPLHHSDGLKTFLGFDRQSQRIVEIRTTDHDTPLGASAEQALRERVALGRPIVHPGVARIFETGEQDGQFYFVNEFVDGERLTDYSERVGTLPRNLAASLAIQMCDIAALLIDYPRLLASVRPEDFAISLERGWLLTLRLTDMGFDRPEVPLRDSELAARWIRHVGSLLEAFTQGKKLAFVDGSTSLSVAGPLTALEQSVRRQPGVLAVSEIKRLKHTLLHGLGFDNSPGNPTLHYHPAFRAVTDPVQVPRGPLFHLLMESGELRELLTEKYEVIASSALDWSAYRIEAAVKSPRSPGSNKELTQIHILPPDRLLDDSGPHPLNQKMSHSYLKDHPNLVRTRSLASGDDFTLVADEPVRGFSLMNLVTARGHLSPQEVLLLLRQIDRALSHFQGASFGLGRIDPWWILFHFEEPLDPAKQRELVAHESITNWPAWEIKFRISQATEVFVQSAASPWPHLEDRLQRAAQTEGKEDPRSVSLIALAVWMLEADRHEWLLTESLWTEKDPLSQNPAFEQYVKAAVGEFDNADGQHRARLLAEMRHCFLTTSPMPALAPESPTQAPQSTQLTFSAA